MDNVIYWIYLMIFAGERIKPLRICHPLKPNTKPDPGVMHKKWFKKSTDGMVGKFDDVYMGCSVKQYFSELRKKSK